MVELPVPGAAIGFGLKLTVTPLGCPLADKLIAELKPFEAVVLMVEGPELPCTTETDEGEALMLKFATTLTVTLAFAVIALFTVSVAVML